MKKITIVLICIVLLVCCSSAAFATPWGESTITDYGFSHSDFTLPVSTPTPTPKPTPTPTPILRSKTNRSKSSNHVIYGDVNNDGIVSYDDIYSCYRMLVGLDTPEISGDLNNDGYITVLDLDLMSDFLTDYANFPFHTCPLAVSMTVDGDPFLFSCGYNSNQHFSNLDTSITTVVGYASGSSFRAYRNGGFNNLFPIIADSDYCPYSLSTYFDSSSGILTVQFHLSKPSSVTTTSPSWTVFRFRNGYNSSLNASEYLRIIDTTADCAVGLDSMSFMVMSNNFNSNVVTVRFGVRKVVSNLSMRLTACGIGSSAYPNGSFAFDIQHHFCFDRTFNLTKKYIGAYSAPIAIRNNGILVNLNSLSVDLNEPTPFPSATPSGGDGGTVVHPTSTPTSTSTPRPTPPPDPMLQGDSTNWFRGFLEMCYNALTNMGNFTDIFYTVNPYLAVVFTLVIVFSMLKLFLKG